ncbi:hypothetical protein [Phormidium sp. CCY1219]|uniref:hypothetical protein n=1 Tax=Phormidium sp. CCY1219 TaxID=2886104 RepID=UPI002D1EA300|nr:hypothetical protein [Phormidium sp. CCY1219]MEB3831576.1 hypothetical protein [Phormidium sp. CCY1219]
MAQTEPTIFLCSQAEYPESSEVLREAIESVLEEINRRSRFSLRLESAVRSLRRTDAVERRENVKTRQKFAGDRGDRGDRQGRRGSTATDFQSASLRRSRICPTEQAPELLLAAQERRETRGGGVWL